MKSLTSPRWIFAAACVSFATCAAAVDVSLAAPAGAREATVTLSQILRRQDENWATMKDYRGTVIRQRQAISAAEMAMALPAKGTPRPVGGSAPGQPKAADRIPAAVMEPRGLPDLWPMGLELPDVARISFLDSHEQGRTATLILSAEEGIAFSRRGSVADWTKVTGAFLQDGKAGLVYRAVGRDRDAVELEVTSCTSALMPGVFSPRALTQTPLDTMDPDRVQLLEFEAAGRFYVRAAAQDGATSQVVYAMYDCAQRYLPVEWGRVVNGRYAERCTILLRPMPSGTIVGARVDRRKYREDVEQERVNWYYEFLAINSGVRKVGFEFFTLPKGTKLPAGSSLATPPELMERPAPPR